MLRRSIFVLTVAVLTANSAPAQVVRFQTTVGDFDMVLNPTNNPQLQEHVDNLLAYVEDQRYRGVWINRAAENFVLQMGSFYSHARRPPPTIESTRSVAAFPPVTGQPGIPGLSNTVGTVSMALQAGNPNSGTSSFFVNLADNTGLDAEFTVFAAIPDMTVINQIMSLMQVDLTENPDFGVGPGNLAFIDVPLDDEGRQVFIKRAFVVSDAMAIAMANAAVAPVMASSMAAAGSGGLSATPSPAANSSAAIVPEPASAALLLIAASGAALAPRRARRRSRLTSSS